MRHFHNQKPRKRSRNKNLVAVVPHRSIPHMNVNAMRQSLMRAMNRSIYDLGSLIGIVACAAIGVVGLVSFLMSGPMVLLLIQTPLASIFSAAISMLDSKHANVQIVFYLYLASYTTLFLPFAWALRQR